MPDDNSNEILNLVIKRNFINFKLAKVEPCKEQLQFFSIYCVLICETALIFGRFLG